MTGMQALLRQAGEPALLALARSCGWAAAAPCQQAACSIAARQLATSADGSSPASSAGSREEEGQPAAASAGPSDGSNGSGGGGANAGKPGYPHRFNEPYRPDIRRFVHRMEQQQPPPADSVAQGSELSDCAPGSDGLPPPRVDLLQQASSVSIMHQVADMKHTQSCSRETLIV